MALTKLRVVAFSDNKFTKVVGTYDVLVNPDTYAHNYSIQYNDATGQGKNGTFTQFLPPLCTKRFPEMKR